MCGIFGFASNKNDKKFAVDKFAMLGIFNDKRGGDSCGAFIDREINWGVDKSKLFINFIRDTPFVSSFKDAHVNIAVGHCRKASVGTIGLSTAQPVEIRNEDTNEIEFVFTHNGTLLNHQELADKYLSKVPPHYTDSQILAYTIYHYGPKVLLEYNGAGAFAWVDYRPTDDGDKTPRTYLFKGESANIQYGAYTSEERPLYIIHTKEGIWWSSIAESLSVITYGEGNVIDIFTNTLFCIKEGQIVSKEVYDRKSKYQAVSTFNRSYYPKASVAKKEVAWQYTISPDWVEPTIADKGYAAGDKIYFMDGFYYYKGQKVSGEKVLYSTGYIGYSGSTVGKKFYFYKGRMLNSLYAYEIAKRLEETLDKGEQWKDNWLASLCYQGIYYSKDLDKFYECEKYTSSLKTFTGDFQVFFTTDPIIYKIKKGRIVGHRVPTEKWPSWTAYDSYVAEDDMDCYVQETANLTREDINAVLDVEIKEIKTLTY
jgi:hypothetical protein